jgi:hypothetical protein
LSSIDQFSRNTGAMADQSDELQRASRAVARAHQLVSSMKVKAQKFRETAQMLNRQKAELRMLRAEARRYLANLTALATSLRDELGSEAQCDPRAPTLEQSGQGSKETQDALEALMQAIALGDPTAPDLEETMRSLDDHGIRSGVHTSTEGMLAWLADHNYRRRRDGIVRRSGPGQWPEAAAVARWLHQEALRRFPDSGYARLHRAAETPVRVFKKD